MAPLSLNEKLNKPKAKQRKRNIIYKNTVFSLHERVLSLFVDTHIG